MKTLIRTFFAGLLVTFVTFSANSAELNEVEIYEGTIKGAYSVTNLPLLPGNWKVDDLEKSGSINSGNFYVYATMIPAEANDATRRYNDIIFYAILGSKSEETSYRKTFYGCEGGFYSLEGSIIKIDSRGSGNFEEYCNVHQTEFQTFNYFFTDCSDVCVEVGINLDTNNYKNDRKSFEEITELLSENVRKIVRSGNGSLDFLNDYKIN
tara:strand:- start:17 stop:643 length:627 start_codon:yes stop_codon:yes gene_type:complete